MPLNKGDKNKATGLDSIKSILMEFTEIPPYLEMALEAFGPHRIMWGSDYPPVSVREGYHNALHGVMNHTALADQAVKDWVMNKTAAAVFKLT